MKSSWLVSIAFEQVMVWYPESNCVHAIRWCQFYHLSIVSNMALNSSLVFLPLPWPLPGWVRGGLDDPPPTPPQLQKVHFLHSWRLLHCNTSATIPLSSILLKMGCYDTNPLQMGSGGGCCESMPRCSKIDIVHYEAGLKPCYTTYCCYS